MSFPGSILLSQGDILQEYSEKRHPLGTRGYTRDRRVFAYAKSGAAIGVGRLCQAAVASALDDAQALAGTSDSKTTYSTNSKTLYLSTDSSMSTANYFRDGIVFISSGTGIGQYAQIKAHSISTAFADVFPTVTIFPEDGWTVKPTTSVKVGLIRNVYDDVITQDVSIASQALTAMSAGVTVRAISAADKYFWLQTWGPCVCRAQAALTIGLPVVAGESSGCSDGVIQTPTAPSSLASTAAVSERVHVGQVLQVGAADGAALIYLMLAP